MLTPLVAGAFGKLPTHGDFVRVGEQAPVELLDRWSTGLALSLSRTPQRAAAWAAGASVIAMFPHRGRWWAAVLTSSRDSVGRPFPFIAFAGCDEAAIAGEPALLPLVFMPFLQQALMDAAAGWANVGNALSSWAAPVDPVAAGQQLLAWLGGDTAGALWTGMLGDARDPRRPRVLAEVAAIARDSLGAGLRLTPVASPAHLAFWLYLLDELHPPAPSLIVIHAALPQANGAAGAPALTVLWPGAPLDAGVAALWPAVASDAAILDPVVGAGLDLDADLSSVLADPTVSLRDLLHALLSPGRTAMIRVRGHG